MVEIITTPIFASQSEVEKRSNTARDLSENDIPANISVVIWPYLETILKFQECDVCLQSCAKKCYLASPGSVRKQR